LTWQVFGPGLAALGALALGALLFALQRLRVRHHERTVVTTLFWRQAVEETRARVLVERFRHPLAFLLLLALALSIWFAAAGPRMPARGERDLVLLLDGSAGMGLGDRFERATEALRVAVADAPRDATTVLWCGAEVRALLLPGEDPLLLEARLEDLAPAQAPASLERAVWDLVHGGERARPVAVRVAGDAPVRAVFLERLPADVDLARLPLEGAGEERAHGVAALGVSGADSGAWDRVDVLAVVRGATSVSVDLDGTPVAGVRDGDRLYLSDLPAEGGRLTLRARTSAGDETCELVLPVRRQLRVVTGGTLPAPLLASLVADPAVRLVPAGSPADVAVRRRGEGVGVGLPAFELVPGADQAEAFLLTSEDEDPERALLEGVLELGLDRIDATSLADATGVAITAGARSGAVRELAVWEELLGPGYDLVEGRTFPLLVGRAVRWLGGVQPFAQVVAAGEPVPLELDGLVPLGLDPVPPRAGRYTTTDGASVAAALLTPGDADAAEAVAADTGRRADLVMWLTVLALLLTLVEGYLFRTGRTP
jgi:hypothetical protein